MLQIENTQSFEEVGEITIINFPEAGFGYLEIVNLLNESGGGLLHRTEEDIREYVERGELYILRDKNNELVGCFALEPLGEFAEQRIWEIGAVAIKNGDGRFRGKGIGNWISEIFGEKWRDKPAFLTSTTPAMQKAVEHYSRTLFQVSWERALKNNPSKESDISALFRQTCICSVDKTGTETVSQPAEGIWTCKLRDKLCKIYATEGLINLCRKLGITLYDQNGDSLESKITDQKQEFR